MLSTFVGMTGMGRSVKAQKGSAQQCLPEDIGQFG
jgi:hypothetical protein